MAAPVQTGGGGFSNTGKSAAEATSAITAIYSDPRAWVPWVVMGIVALAALIGFILILKK